MFSLGRSSARALLTAASRRSHSPPAAQIQITRSFATKIVDIRRGEQKSAWQSYLSGSMSEASLFAQLDLNKSGTITVEEIDYFLDSVDRTGVDENKFRLLQQLGDDHMLDRREFHRWLCMATDVKNDGEGFRISDNEDSSSSSSSSSDDDDERDNGYNDDAVAKKASIVIDARRGLQSMVLETFLTTGHGASDLFKMIDLNRSNTISVEEISYFIDSVGGRGEFQWGELAKLAAMGKDHELTAEEFYEWLSDSTGVDLAEDVAEDEEKENEQSSIRDDAEGCTPGQW